MIRAALHPHRAGLAGRRFKRAWGRPERVLNVGSGNDMRPGWVNMDYYAPGADVKHDITQTPWPFDDNAFDGIYCSHILEHVPHLVPDAMGAILQEMERVLAPGGRICILVPYPNSACDLANLSHYRKFHPKSFHWLDPKSKGSLRYMYNVPNLYQKFQGVQRAFEIFGFNTGYHPEKFGLKPWNIGPKAGLIFILSKLSN